MNFLLGTFAIIGILFMITFMFIGIWLFIVALKAFHQLRYKNYILEKIYQKLDMLTNKMHEDEDVVSKDFLDFFDLDNNDQSNSSYENIKDFEQQSK